MQGNWADLSASAEATPRSFQALLSPVQPAVWLVSVARTDGYPAINGQGICQKKTWAAEMCAAIMGKPYKKPLATRVRAP